MIELETIEPIGTQMALTAHGVIEVPRYAAVDSEGCAREWRRAARLTLREAALTLGMSVVDVSGLERGSRRPVGGWEQLRVAYEAAAKEQTAPCPDCHALTVIGAGGRLVAHEGGSSRATVLGCITVEMRQEAAKASGIPYGIMWGKEYDV